MNTSELKEMRMQCFPGRVVEYVQTINFLGDVSWSFFTGSIAYNILSSIAIHILQYLIYTII